MSEDFKSLQELTGRNSGVILNIRTSRYGGYGYTYGICNWDRYNGIPQTMSDKSKTLWGVKISIGCDKSKIEWVDDIGEYLGNKQCEYDKLNKADKLNGIQGRMYIVNSGFYKVIVPDGWE